MFVGKGEVGSGTGTAKLWMHCRLSRDFYPCRSPRRIVSILLRLSLQLLCAYREDLSSMLVLAGKNTAADVSPAGQKSYCCVRLFHRMLFAMHFSLPIMPLTFVPIIHVQFVLTFFMRMLKNLLEERRIMQVEQLQTSLRRLLLLRQHNNSKPLSRLTAGRADHQNWSPQWPAPRILFRLLPLQRR